MEGIREVLYAEDAKADALLFDLTIKSLQIDVNLTRVEDGQKLMELLATATEGWPDLILLDLKMPFKDGLECLAEIRQNKKFDNIPVIIFSTSTHPADVEAAYFGKANIYIQKPLAVDGQIFLFNRLFARTRPSFFPQPPIEHFVWGN